MTERTNMLIDTGLGYTPADPVRVSVVHREHRTTVSDGGLPVVPVGPTEDEVIRRVAVASLAFYQELLDLSP